MKYNLSFDEKYIYFEKIILNDQNLFMTSKAQKVLLSILMDGILKDYYLKSIDSIKISKYIWLFYQEFLEHNMKS